MPNLTYQKNMVVPSYTDTDTLEIFINDDLTAIEKQFELMCQVFDVCLVWSGLAYRLEESQVDHEDIVRELATHVVDVWVSNPHVFPVFEVPDTATLAVGPIQYFISNKHLLNAGGRLLLGVTKYADKNIDLLNNDLDFPQHDTKRIVTFIHELFHALMDVSGLNIRLEEADNYPTTYDISRLMASFFTMTLQMNEVFYGNASKS